MEADGERLGRLLRRLQAYVDADALREEDLRAVLEDFGADADLDARVRAVIDGSHLSLLPPAVPGPDVPGPGPVDPVARPGTGVNDLAGAAAAAVRVLEADRLARTASRRVLTAEEEVGLAILLRGGALALAEPLPTGYVAGLPRRGQAYLAYEAMMLHNVRLVHSLLRQYEGQGLDHGELASAGYAGLHRAIELFDATRGWKFSTYGTNWIKQKVGRAVADEGRLIRLPVHMHEQVSGVMRAYRRLQVENDHVRLDDLAELTGLPHEKVRACLRYAAGIVSLNLPLGDRGTPFGELIPDEAAQEVGGGLVLSEQARLLRGVLQALPDKEGRVLELRHGLDGDGEPRTLEQVGKMLGLTRERIRQIEKQAKVHAAAAVTASGLR